MLNLGYFEFEFEMPTERYQSLGSERSLSGDFKSHGIITIPGLRSLHRSIIQSISSGFCYSGSYDSTSDRG